MKKIINKKIFILIILCIISFGIGVYAVSKYSSADFTYIKEDGSSVTLSAALNELYNNKTECEKDSFCSKVKIGDYVKMTPTSTSYTISKESTGYDSNQTINPSELNLWRIIKINENGTIEMVSENVSSTNVYFKGQTGYLKLVGTLNTIASQYENSKYTINSRIMGYGGQTEVITNTSKFTTKAPWTSSTKDNSNETLGGGDIMYEADTNLVIRALGTLVATTPSGTATSYWLGSRYYYYYGSTDYSWYGRYVYAIDEGRIDYIVFNDSYLYRYYSGWSSYAISNAIRPILTLKSGIKATGSGTKTDPWVLE